MRLGGRGTVILVKGMRVCDDVANTMCGCRKELDGSVGSDYLGRDALVVELGGKIGVGYIGSSEDVFYRIANSECDSVG
jgi:hypothetical protein